MSHLTEHELDELLENARTADMIMLSPRNLSRVWAPLAPRIQRLLQEQRELREQAGERERMAAQEIGG